MRFVAAVAALAAVASVVSAAAGCSLLISTSDLTGSATCEGNACTSPGAPDGGAGPLRDAATVTLTCGDADVVSDEMNCGTCGNVCSGQTPRCLAESCVPGCPGGIVYVSPAGADSNDGCTRTSPLATITHAIDVVSGQNATGEEIHACHGTYTEANMVLDYPVSLLGSYDCSTWTRSATYGYPTFDGVNATILSTTDANPSGDTLAVAGDVITSAVLVDGLTVQGPGTGNFTKLGALIVSGTATPVISNDDIEGAASSTVTTVGLRLSIEGKPLVMNDRIGGGGGTVGSIGVDVGTSSALYLHDNVISGGTSVNASWGVLANTDVPLAGQPEYVMHNTINGGTGTNVEGLDVTDSSLSVIGNTITGGAAACAGGECDAIGVHIIVDESELFSVTVAQNRITSGTVSVPMSGTQSMIGLYVNGLDKLDILDNAIQAGSGTNADGNGIYLQNVSAVNVQGNTVYGFQTALNLDAIGNVDVGGNLFLADDTGTGVLACTGTIVIDSFSSNAFVNMTNLVLSSCSAPALTSVSSIEALYGKTAVHGASGNRRVSSTCTGDSATQCATIATCLPAPANDAGIADNQNACIGRVLANWDNASQGAADLLDVSRTWKLASTAPCGIAQSFATPLTDSLGLDGGTATATNYDLVDILGATRANPFSIGAYQDNGSCNP